MTLSDPLLVSLFYVFAAEMGDKTQLVALAFATRYSAGTVLLGVFGATLAVHLFSVALGEVMGLTIPAFWIEIFAGVAFLGFGLWTLRGDELEEEKDLNRGSYGPLMTVAVAFFLAELGDKTMLMTVTIASKASAFVAVWIGSTLGMVAADGLAIAAGRLLGSRLPEKAIKIGAAAVFLVTGVVTIAGALYGD